MAFGKYSSSSCFIRRPGRVGIRSNVPFLNRWSVACGEKCRLLFSTTTSKRQNYKDVQLKHLPKNKQMLFRANFNTCLIWPSRTNNKQYSIQGQGQTRNYSLETYNKYFSSEVAPIGFAQNVLESIHLATGLPWWGSIALSTVLLRSIVTLPLVIYSLHVMARVELLQPEIASLSQELKKEVAMAVKKFGWDTKTARYKYNFTMRKLIRNLYIRENCHPAKSSLVVWFQIPLWFSVSFALRNMSGAVPTDENNQEAPFLSPGLETEGTLWFPDLTIPDSTWILPLVLGITNLLNIELHDLATKKRSRFQKWLTYIMRGVSLVMIPVGAVVPSCMCYYWACSSIFGLAQNLVFKLPSVRRLIRLPVTPSESQTPFRDLYIVAKQKYSWTKS